MDSEIANEVEFLKKRKIFVAHKYEFFTQKEELIYVEHSVLVG